MLKLSQYATPSRRTKRIAVNISSLWLLPALIMGLASVAGAQTPPGASAPPTAPGAPPTVPGSPPTAPGAPPTGPGTPLPPGATPFPRPPFPPGVPIPPPGFPIPPTVIVVPAANNSTPAPPKQRIETLDQAIEALKTGDASYAKAYQPLSKLKQWPVDAKRRNEVAGLLDPLLTTNESTVRRAAQDAVKAWGTPRNVPTLLKLLEWQDWGDQTSALEGLAAIGGKEAAQAIAAKLPDKELRLRAKDALETMGPAAEEFVWPHLTSGDDQVFRYACDVLGKVGTAKSLAKLKARRERDSSRQSAVRSAIRDLESRLVKR